MRVIILVTLSVVVDLIGPVTSGNVGCASTTSRYFFLMCMTLRAVVQQVEPVAPLLNVAVHAWEPPIAMYYRVHVLNSGLCSVQLFQDRLS